MASSSVQIRFATEKDIPQILEMIIELADYEHAVHEVAATSDSLRATLSFAPDASPDSIPPAGGPGYAKTLLAFSPTSDAPDRPVGMALYFHNYSTWRSAPGIYLEDLYVRESARGKGAGKALLRRLAVETLRVGGKRLEWSVLKWNQPSIEFYEALGALRMEEWVGYRLEGNALEKMAA